jgi:hypothetical protein
LDPKIVDLQHILLSWEDTLAALANMDLVITSCTSIAHAAAALGKPTWVITPVLPYHTWAVGAPESNTSPWYPCVEIIRQKKFGVWEETFEELYQKLIDKFNLTETTKTDSIDDVEFVEFKETKQLPVLPEIINEEDEMKQNYIFIAGLPKSGGNIIQQILAQNPKFECFNNSGLFELISSVNYNWKNMGCNPDNQSKLDVLQSIVHSYHKSFHKDTIIEKQRQWINCIPMLEALLGKQIKMIIPVRNPAEILAVYEIQRKNNFLDPVLNKEMASQGTIAARCMTLSSQTGELGLAHAQILDAVTSGFKDRLLFVDYNKFCNEPKSQLERIYKFLEVDNFEHLTDTINKDSVVAADTLGFDLYQQYNSQIFWQSWI